MPLFRHQSLSESPLERQAVMNDNHSPKKTLRFLLVYSGIKMFYFSYYFLSAAMWGYDQNLQFVLCRCADKLRRFSKKFAKLRKLFLVLSPKIFLLIDLEIYFQLS